MKPSKKSYHQKLFSQLCGKLRPVEDLNYFSYVHHFINVLQRSPNFVEDTNFEIAGCFMKDDKPYLLDTTKEI